MSQADEWDYVTFDYVNVLNTEYNIYKFNAFSPGIILNIQCRY